MRNNQYLRLKDIWGGLLLFIISISMCGCSQSAKSEREIIADLQQNPAFISETVKIRDYEIIKRQTSRNNYSDLIYLTVYVNEDKFKCTFSYIMEYTLYNDGWILENVTQYLDGPWSIDGLSSDQLSSDVTDNDFYFDDYVLEIEDCEILNEGYSYDGENYEKWFEVAITASNPIFDYRALYRAVYKVTGDGWRCQYAIPNFSGYSPAFSPDISATDSIMESLELGSGTSATSYDSYEYVRTETDWENCAETRYYTATKNWWFGTETYLVSIPLKFSLENGEDSTQWTYNSNSIESSLQNIDWMIEGIWEANGVSDPINSRTQGSWDVNLNIRYIIPMDNPNEYYACVSSDSIFWGIYVNYSCVSDGYISATISQSGPGEYKLELDGLTNGTFWIQQNSSGVSWRNVTLKMTRSVEDEIKETEENIVSATKSLGLDVINYDPENPIYGLWKGLCSNGWIEIICYCPNGTVVWAPTIVTPVYFTGAYTYDGTYLIEGEKKQLINWENDNSFSIPASDEQDSFWIKASRILTR